MLRFPTPAPHAKLYFWNSGTTICKIRGSASAGMSGYFYLLFAIRPGGVNMVKNIQLKIYFEFLSYIHMLSTSKI